MGNLSIFDTAILVAYLAAMVVIGLYFSRKNKSTEHYFVGGRSFSGWIIGLGMVGTSISSVTFVAFPADAFKTTWIRYIPTLALPFATLIAAFVFLPLFRKLKYTSVYEYLEHRFGQSIRAYASFAFLIHQIVRISIILYLLTILVYGMVGVDPIICILVTGLCVAIYTVFGGIRAVLWTDVIQTVLLFLGAIVCVLAISMKLPGGFSEIINVGRETGKLSFSDVSPDGKLIPIAWGFALHAKTFIMMFFLGMTIWLTEYSSNQALVQKYFASKSIHETRKAILVKVCASMPIWGFYMFIGTALFVFFKRFPVTEATEMLNGTRKAEEILPFYVMNYLPSGVVGLIIASALAAAMGAISNAINSFSTVFVIDMYKRHFVKNKSDKHYLAVSLITAGAASVMMMVGAIIFIKAKTQTIQDTGTLIASLLGAGLLGIYLIGFFTKRGDSRAVWFGITGTVLFTLWGVLSKNGYLPGWMTVPFDLYYTMIFGNIVMVAATLCASLVFKRKKPLEAGLTIYD
jgi:SSS family solute:Na+ symporter